MVGQAVWWDEASSLLVDAPRQTWTQTMIPFLIAATNALTIRSKLKWAYVAVEFAMLTQMVMRYQIA
jgi:hypothetical protein